MLMRNVINISLPAEMAKAVRQEVKRGRYATTSEFFRHLLRMWNNHQVAEIVAKSEAEFAAGKGKLLKTLRDLRWLREDFFFS